MEKNKKPLATILTVISCFWLISISFLSTPRLVAAQSASGSIQIEPAFQEITLAEGQATASAQIKITNSSQTEQLFDISAISIQQFDNDGNIILANKPQDGVNITLASFITVPETLITIPQQTSTIVPITITNSQSLGSGGHYAALVARLSGQSSNDQVVLPAISSFLLVRKEGGEQYHISLIRSSFQNQFWWNKVPEEVELTFTNQGNTHLIPRGTIEIRDPFKRLIAKSIINENSLYVFPNTQRRIVQKIMPVSRPLPFSLLKVQISGTTQPGEVPFQQSSWIVSVNVLGLGIGFISSILIFFIIRFICHRGEEKTGHA